MQLSLLESEGTNGDCIETVDENGMEVFENKVAEKLSERDVCFPEPEAIQNSTGSSGVSVLSEMTNDMDEYNPSILPDTTLLASITVDDLKELKRKSVADRDLDDCNSFSLPCSDLELRTIDKEGVDSYSMDEFTDKSHEVCKPPIPEGRKTAKHQVRARIIPLFLVNKWSWRGWGQMSLVIIINQRRENITVQIRIWRQLRRLMTAHSWAFCKKD